MERVIKFRAWDKKLYQILSHEELSPQNNKLVYGRRATLDSILLHDDYEIMQFTGFTDAGKSELYDGDIIENDGVVYKIEWCEHSGCWDCIDSEGNNINLCELASSNETWLQGNIYENPELLSTDKTKTV